MGGGLLWREPRDTQVLIFNSVPCLFRSPQDIDTLSPPRGPLGLVHVTQDPEMAQNCLVLEWYRVRRTQSPSCLLPTPSLFTSPASSIRFKPSGPVRDTFTHVYTQLLIRQTEQVQAGPVAAEVLLALTLAPFSGCVLVKSSLPGCSP